MRTYLLTFLLAQSALAGPFKIEKNANDGLKITLDGKPFAEYVVDQANKPYFWRVHGPSGKLMTRSYPMEQVEGERKDHPHHRGINFGHESINGANSWAEKASFGKNPDRAKQLGRIKHRRYESIESGATAKFVQLCDYLDPAGKKILEEKRTITFHMFQGKPAMDFDQDLIATEGPAQFSDRKDAGLSIRVATSMDVDSKKGGKIINANGDTDKGAWSKKATWCDYHGPVDGETVGVAILNHPSSFGHPTSWHVRTYGLFTANPFASKQFNKKNPDASFELKRADVLKLRHRFVFHTGDEKEAKIAEAYEAYAKEKR